MARLYRKRWTLETVFQRLAAYFHWEINTLGYPKAALFGLCLALVATSQGMMIAMPAREWRVFGPVRTPEMVATLLALAAKVQLKSLRRGPKKPRLKREGNPKRPHVSTARLLMERTDDLVAP